MRRVFAVALLVVVGAGGYVLFDGLHGFGARAPKQRSSTSGATSEDTERLRQDVEQLRASLASTQMAMHRLQGRPEPSAEASAAAPPAPPPDEAPVRPPTMEERKEFYQRIRGEKTALYDATIAAGVPDRAFSHVAEGQILESLKTNGMKEAKLVSLQCGGDLCRAEFQHGNEQEFQQSLSGLTQLRYGTAFVVGDPVSEGGFQSLVYFSRPDTNLPTDEGEVAKR